LAGKSVFVNSISVEKMLLLKIRALRYKHEIEKIRRYKCVRLSALADCRVLWCLFGRGGLLAGFLVPNSAIPWRLPDCAATQK
jgi:hypothetical protein